MIRTEREFNESKRRLAETRAAIAAEQELLVADGYEQESIELMIAPQAAFLAQVEDEIAQYERVCRGNITPVHSLMEIGRTLIELRIAAGLSQRGLAERLGVAESQVSRDERNEYYGVTMDRAQRVLDVLLGATNMELECRVTRLDPARKNNPTTEPERRRTA